jgi:Uma2 family endonuclease
MAAEEIMPAVQLKLGPADQGQELTLEEFEEAEYVSGFRYELIEGRLYVSPAPNLAENMLESWLRDKLGAYSKLRPDVVNFVATRGRVFLPTRVRPSTPEPDIAAYVDAPTSISRNASWEELSPILVVEILVDGDIWKDLSRNPKTLPQSSVHPRILGIERQRRPGRADAYPISAGG